MSKYTIYSRRPPPKPRPWKIHPIWRGIGCLMLIIIPILAYAGGVLLVEANSKQGWVPVPGEFMRSVNLPAIGVVRHLVATLFVTLLLTFIGFGGLMILYALIYRLVGPPSLGPLDAPPVRMPQNQRRRG
jgi:hypothetical protein